MTSFILICYLALAYSARQMTLPISAFGWRLFSVMAFFCTNCSLLQNHLPSKVIFILWLLSCHEKRVLTIRGIHFIFSSRWAYMACQSQHFSYTEIRVLLLARFNICSQDICEENFFFGNCQILRIAKPRKQTDRDTSSAAIAGKE